MVYQLSYRRPTSQHASSIESVSRRERQISLEEARQSTASSCSMCNGIPEPLSFDRVVNSAACPPCTLRDFLNYLKYIEHSAENLQFFLWFKSYRARFAELSAAEKPLSPEWTFDDEDIEPSKSPRSVKISADTANILKGTSLDPLEKPPMTTTRAVPNTCDPTAALPRSTKSSTSHSRQCTNESNTTDGVTQDRQSSHNTPTSVQKDVESAFKDAGLKWNPFTIQPFRDEISRIIATYIADGSPRQINISFRDRKAVLHALANTTHPSAFYEIVNSIEWILRYQSHPNFLRWTICNGNRPRVLFARSLGVAGVFIGILVGVLTTLSNGHRAWRVFAIVPLFVGISTVIAAWKGMCVVMHGMHHRHLRPWELFQDQDVETGTPQKTSFDSEYSGITTNSYEDEPWVAKYDERSSIRKIFDRELWVEEPALRQIQDTIFVQSLIGALIGSSILTAIFLAVPAGRFY